jgi:hypothetical protein
MTPAWKYRHERTRHRVGSTARRSKSSQGTKSSTVPGTRYPVRAGAVVDVIQDGPSMAGRIAWLGAQLMIRPTLSVGSYLPSAPWPWGLVEFAARAITPAPGTVRAIGRRDDVVRQHLPSYFMDNALPMMNGAVPFVSSPIRSSTPPTMPLGMQPVCGRGGYTTATPRTDAVAG